MYLNYIYACDMFSLCLIRIISQPTSDNFVQRRYDFSDYKRVRDAQLQKIGELYWNYKIKFFLCDSS